MASRGAPRGRGSGGSRGGAARGNHAPTGPAGEKPKKENIVNLAQYMDKQINISFAGGREVTGTLKGFDQLMNLVLDDVKEKLRG